MIFINGNTPSSKNSRMRTKAGFFITSKTVRKYLKEHEDEWSTPPEEFSNLVDADFPVVIGFHFVRGTKHRWDFTNIAQICTDLMVKHKWIPDDCVDYLIPQCMIIDSKYWSYSKDSPGVYIEIIQKSSNEGS